MSQPLDTNIAGIPPITGLGETTSAIGGKPATPSKQKPLDWFTLNPNASDIRIRQAQDSNGWSSDDVASSMGTDASMWSARYKAASPYFQFSGMVDSALADKMADDPAAGRMGLMLGSRAAGQPTIGMTRTPAPDYGLTAKAADSAKKAAAALTATSTLGDTSGAAGLTFGNGGNGGTRSDSGPASGGIGVGAYTDKLRSIAKDNFKSLVPYSVVGAALYALVKYGLDTNEALDAINATPDPIATLNALQQWTDQDPNYSIYGDESKDTPSATDGLNFGDAVKGLGPGDISQLGVSLGQFGDTDNYGLTGLVGGNGGANSNPNAGMGYGQGFGGQGWGGTTTGGF